MRCRCGGAPESSETEADLVVVPYLLLVEELDIPSEPGRDSQWCSSEKAKELLRRDREPRFRDGHDTVIDEGAKRLGTTGGDRVGS